MNNYSYFLKFLYIYNKNIMRKKLKEEDKKIRVTITLDRLIAELASQRPNKSGYIEKLIYTDLLKNNEI